MNHELIRQMLIELQSDKNYVVQSDIIGHGHEIILKGVRPSIDRIGYVGNLHGSLLDIGCNVGSFCNYFQLQGVKTTGVDVNPLFIKWAKIVNPNADYHCLDLNKKESWDHPIFQRKYDTVFYFSMHDHLDHPHEISKLLRRVTGKTLFIEAHADGDFRIDFDVTHRGRTYKSWTHILEDVLGVKHELMGFTDHCSRPFWKCHY